MSILQSKSKTKQNKCLPTRVNGLEEEDEEEKEEEETKENPIPRYEMNAIN